MKLNPDCVRDVLLSIEELSSYNGLISSEQLLGSNFLKDKYDKDEVLYHIQQLDWSGLIKVPSRCKTLDGEYFINDLSPAGHEFLSNIRMDTNWNKVKSISKKAGTEALNSLKSIAENVVATAIKTSLGLN